MKKQVSKKQFADMCGISPAAITNAIRKGTISAACDGNRIDINHPAASQYLDKHRDRQRKQAMGPTLDPDVVISDKEYEEAALYCLMTDTYAVGALRDNFGWGDKKARAVLDKMATNDLIPSGRRVDPGHLRGTAAMKEAKKRAVPQGDVGNPEVPENMEEFAEYRLKDLYMVFGTDSRFVDWLKAVKEIQMIKEKQLKNATTEGELVHRELVKVGVVEPIDNAHLQLLTDGARTLSVRVVAMHEGGKTQPEIEKYISDTMGSFIKPAKDKVKKVMRNYGY